MTSVRCLAFACLCLVLPAVAAAQATSTAPAVELQGPYLDRKAGFSIQYPVGTDRQRVTSSTNLVQWVCRDAATNAVSWAVTVQRAVEGKDAVNVKAYASTVVDKLAKSGFKSEYLQIGELAGKDMFEIAGASTVLGKVAFWQRQVWVQDQPGAFLIVLVSGPVDAKDKLDAIFRAVTPTLKLYDAAALLKAQEESLHRGKEFLAGLTEEKLRQAADPKPRCFLLKSEGKPVACLIETSQVVETPFPGLRVTLKSLVKLKEPVQITRQMTVAWNLSKETWQDVTTVGARKDTEDGTLENGTVNCVTVTAANKPPTQKHSAKAPEGYLPHAIQMMLPRLLPLDKKASYSFRGYVFGADRFNPVDMTVEGRESCMVGSKKVECVRLTDQQQDGEGLVRADSAGNVLEIRSSSNVVIESCTPEELLKEFPAAKDLLK